MRKIAIKGPRILYGADPFEKGIIKDTRTGKRTPTDTSVYSVLNRGYWTIVDSDTRDSIANSLRGRK